MIASQGFVDYSRQCPSRHTVENLTPTAVERIPICQTSAPVSSVSFDVWRSMAKPLSSSVEYSSAETYSIWLIFTVEHHLHITSASFLIKFEILLLKRANSLLLLRPFYKRVTVHAVFRLFSVRQCLWSFIAQFCSHVFWVHCSMVIFVKMFFFFVWHCSSICLTNLK